MSFEIADYFVFFATIGISFAIGVFFAIWERKRNTPVDYFLANRSSSTWPIALSFVVTFQSSLMVIGFPAETYAYGIGIAYNVVGCVAAYIFAALFIVPVFHPLKLTSVNEFFHLRYGNNTVRYMSLTAGMIYSLFYMATVMFGTCVALDVVLGIPFWGTILIYTTVAKIYTSVGGIKAVIWTDVFQFIVMVTGILAVLVKSTIGAGGVGKVFEYAKDRIDSTDFSVDPTVRYQVWNTSFGTFIAFLYLTIMQQAMQRMYSTPSVQTARNVYFISSPFYCAILLMTVFQGATIFAYFVAKRCDILDAGIIRNIKAILPFAVLDLFRDLPGLVGLFTASLSSAALSTMSSCLSSLSAVTYEDIIKIKLPHMHDYKATKLSKIVVLIYGLIAMGLAFIVSLVPGSIIVICVSFMGCFNGPIVATFLLSLMFRKATTKGVITGAICGSAITFWVNIGSHFSDVPPYPYLPSGPTDRCYIYGESDFSNESTVIVYPTTNNSYLFTDTQHITPTAATLSPSGNIRNSSPLQTIYRFSFLLYPLKGFVISFFVGILVSLCTSPPEKVDKRCLFSFRKHVIGELCGHHSSIDSNFNEEDEEEVTKFMSKDAKY